ncbi:MAG: ABC transporter ATP-binding protein/permease [Deltaproteobacteria bacterium]|nr:ABC transporter ATP-binding protein/permease [Deltaproteobacteria bacterium]
MMKKFDRAFFRGFWALITPYWTSDQRAAAWGLLAVVVGLNLGIVYISVLFNRWMNGFYNAIQNLDKAGFIKALYDFTWIAAAFIAVAVYMLYLNQLLQIRWRTWLTERYLNEWLARQTYYRIQIFEQTTDNPDQRISEDINALVNLTLNLGLGLLRAVVTLGSFIFILWGISGPLTIPLNGTQIVIPGYMVWAALLYAIVGTWLTMRVGGPLIMLNFNQQRLEADFRYSLVRLRENSESVAIYGGESREKAGFRERFMAVVANFRQIMLRQKRLTWLTSGYNQLSVIFPLLVASPRFFAGQIQLGGLMQISNAFGEVHRSLSFIVDSFVGIAEWKAVVERLLGFTETMDRVQSLRSLEKIRRTETPEGRLEIEGLNVQLPDGKVLSRKLSFILKRGDSLVVTGPSGCGKSTLLRVLAGIWPYGDGAVAIPEAKNLMFLSQKPYLPLGTLREALYYPGAVRPDDREIGALLQLCNLTHLEGHLDEPGNWSQMLSPGEQQRIAFARVFLLKPTHVFLDEATASLDETMEAFLYGALKERLPDTVLVSVGHRSTILDRHDLHLALDTDGSWQFGKTAATARSLS